MIGSAVGFANVLSFSALCYKNGGGAFLIPYILAHVMVGIPMLFLEGIVGQRGQLPLVSALGGVGKRLGKLFGWLSILTCATIGGFYIVLTGFSVAYTYFSAAGVIPPDTAHFFKEVFLKDSGGLTQWGTIAWPVFFATLLVAFFSWVVLARNVQAGIEKLCTIFLPLLGVIVLLFTVVILFLPGAMVGIKHYLIPDFSRLADIALWRDVFGQVFFSLSLGLGIVTGYSRHNKESFSISRAMVKVAVGDFVISFLCGLAIFGCIGFMSVQSGTPFASLVPSDSAFEVGFVIFPMILSSLGEGLSRIFGPIFFFCVFIAGITGVFSIVESIAGNIEIEFKKNRKAAVAIAMGAVMLLSFPFCLGNGQHILAALAPMVLGNAMLLGGIAEIIFFLFLCKQIKTDPLFSRTYPYYALKYFVLPLLLTSLSLALFSELTSPLTFATAVRWGWLALAALLSFTLASRRSPESALLNAA